MKSTLRIARVASTWVRGKRVFQRLAKVGQAPIPVLFYHRVADRQIDSCTISASRFRRQIRFLQANFECIDLADVQHRVSNRASFNRACAITFDDGYADNNEFALPLIVESQLPCTYFVSVDPIRTGESFPHDRTLAHPPSPNSIDDIRHWSNRGIEIGLHTRSHFDFSQPHDASVIESEITSAAAELSDWIGKPVKHFAFPYGLPEQLSESVIEALLPLGIETYCSAFGAYNQSGQDDAQHIRRIHGDPEMSRFYNWMYFDPNKLSQQ